MSSLSPNNHKHEKPLINKVMGLAHIKRNWAFVFKQLKIYHAHSPFGANLTRKQEAF